MYEFWVKGETLYTMILPVLFVILMVLLIVILFLFYYTDKKSKNRKIGATIVLLSAVGAILYGYFQHTSYRHWLEQSSLVNAGVRDRYEIMGYEVLESPELVKSYQSMNLLARFQELDMYEEQPVEEQIEYTYLGTTGRQHYFSMGDEEKYAWRYTGEVVYTDEPTHLSGSQFRLLDNRFESLGFIAESPIYLGTFYINQIDAEQATGEIPITIIHPSEVFKNWNLGHQPTKGTSLGY
ncbi:hypothetical protein VXN63_07020 [Marinilactibacillus sp. XAAS-LB27]|uniref:hypothetical protein n=1 Tax=Marinilactibacillus sp. XAAS-LB27 TaxID=3114538 RepID=UPI002E17BD9F|nr:hypothetical protein [Marinilactibacillus sp. XAAS-LB27]